MRASRWSDQPEEDAAASIGINVTRLNSGDDGIGADTCLGGAMYASTIST